MVQRKGGPKVLRVKADDDTIRVQLLMVETVQGDLGLTADQIGQLRDLAKISEGRSREFSAKLREILPPSRSFPPKELEARKRKFQAWASEWQNDNKASRTKALAMLTPSQNERLEQIRIQAAIPDSMARPVIIKALGLSKEQRAKIRSLCDHMNQKVSARYPDLRDLTPKERHLKLIEFAEESDQVMAEDTKLILNVLTAEQRTKLNKLKGKKVDLTRFHDALMP